MANSRFPPSGGGGSVVVDPAGALTGDGTSGDPLAVAVDGVTIIINGDDELEATGGFDTSADYALTGTWTFEDTIVLPIVNEDAETPSLLFKNLAFDAEAGWTAYMTDDGDLLFEGPSDEQEYTLISAGNIVARLAYPNDQVVISAENVAEDATANDAFVAASTSGASTGSASLGVGIRHNGVNETAMNFSLSGEDDLFRLTSIIADEPLEILIIDPATGIVTVPSLAGVGTVALMVDENGVLVRGS